MNGGPCYLIKWPKNDELDTHSKSNTPFLSSFLTFASIVVGEDMNNMINTPSKPRITRLNVNIPLLPLIFFHRISEGSVTLLITNTVSLYIYSSSFSFKLSFLEKVEIFRFLASVLN